MARHSALLFLLLLAGPAAADDPGKGSGQSELLISITYKYIAMLSAVKQQHGMSVVQKQL